MTFVFASSGPVAADTGLYFRCPGNLITNQLSVSQATEKGCQRAQADGLSSVTPGQQVQAGAGTTSSVSVPVASPSQNARSPVQRRRERAYLQSPARSTERHQTSQPVALPAKGHTQADKVPNQSNSTIQRQRDSDALSILQAELNRTLLAQQNLRSRHDSSTYQVDMHRLRMDEAALRREIERIAR